jgi:hypothetical protein
MSVYKARSRVANEVKKCKASGSDPQSPQVQDARRDLAEAKLQAYIERTVASAPKLSPEQRDRLAILLQSPRTSA